MNLSDIDNIENPCGTTDEEFYTSLQAAINSLSAWSLQGSYGRTMMAAIEDGFCCLGRAPARDYWGNRIPSRDEVQPGTKGSLEYVRQQATPAWADMISNVK
jgi:hypothetical protein